MASNTTSKNVATAVLALLGVALMVTAPMFGAQFLSGILFFGGAALTLTVMVARVKHTLMDEAFGQALEEHIAQEEPYLDLTDSDCQFLTDSGILQEAKTTEI